MYNYCMGLFDRKFKKNAIEVTFVQVLVALSFFVLVGSIAHVFPKDDVGIYGNFRGFVQVLFVLYTMAFDLALARYLGTYSNNKKATKEIFSTVVVLFLISSVVSSLILLTIGDFVSKRFFKGDFSIFLATMFSLFSLGIYKIVYTFFQGKREIRKANMVQFASYFLGNIIISILVLTGVVTSINTIAFLLGFALFLQVIVLFRIMKNNFVFSFRFKEVCVFAIPRSLSVFLSGIALSSSILLATYFYSYNVAADFTITSRVLRIIDIVTYAFNMIFMPLIAEKVEEGNLKVISDSLSPFQDIVVLSGIVGSFLVFYLAKVLILSWLPERFLPSVFILQLMAPSVFFYFYFVMFRSIIHSLEVRPIQTYIEITGVFVLFLCFFVLFKLKLSAAITISMSVNAYFFSKALYSFLFLKKRLNLQTRKCLWGVNALIILLLGAFSLKCPIFSFFVFVISEGAIVFRYYTPILKSIINKKGA